MLIKINKPNNELNWIVIQTDSIVSVQPAHSTPNHCLVTMLDRDGIYIKTELVEAILDDIMPIPTHYA